MPAAPFPANEAQRLAALHSYEILDTACEDAFDNIAHLAAELTGSPISLVSLVDRERQWFKAKVGLDAAETPREYAFCAHAILNAREPLVIPDASADPRFWDNPLVTEWPDIRFYAGVPLVNAEGAALGTLCVIDRKPRDLGKEQQKILRRLAATVVTTLELRRAMNRVRDLALSDPLTGLANRSALIEVLEHTIARQPLNGTTFGLLYLDLDGFKGVNDQMGHAAGDRALRSVAVSLRSNLRPGDIVARIGGDEFVVVMIAPPVDVCHTAERLRQIIDIEMRESGLLISASIGAVSFFVAPSSADAALAQADALMYAAKKSGGNRVENGEYGFCLPSAETL